MKNELNENLVTEVVEGAVEATEMFKPASTLKTIGVCAAALGILTAAGYGTYVFAKNVAPKIWKGVKGLFVKPVEVIDDSEIR